MSVKSEWLINNKVIKQHTNSQLKTNNQLYSSKKTFNSNI